MRLNIYFIGFIIVDIIMYKVEFFSDQSNVFSSKVLKQYNMNVRNVNINRIAFADQLRNFEPGKFVRCKYNVDVNRVSFTGCTDYAIKNYLMMMNRMKVLGKDRIYKEGIAQKEEDVPRCIPGDIKGSVDKIGIVDTSGIAQEDKYNRQDSNNGGDMGIGLLGVNVGLEVQKDDIKNVVEDNDDVVQITFHQILFFARNVKDSVLHNISLNDLEGRRHRRYVQFYARYKGREYVRTSYVIVKMKKVHTSLMKVGGDDMQYAGNYGVFEDGKVGDGKVGDGVDILKYRGVNSEVSINNLQPFIMSVNGSFSALNNNPILELNNYLNMLKYTKF